MNTINRRIEQAYMSLSPRSLASHSRKARAWLFVALIAAATELPVIAGFSSVNHRLSASHFARVPAASVPGSSKTDFDWQPLEPATYLSESDIRVLLTATTAIALRMIPVRDHANYKGSVLVNPSGPGESRTESMKMGGLGQNVESTIIRDSFDVLGSDPCGIGGRMPRLDCFAITPERSMWDMREEFQLLNASDDGLLSFYAARARVVGDRYAPELRVDKLRRNLRWSALTMRPFL